MIKSVCTNLTFILFSNSLFSQTNPAITSWLQNNSVNGTYYNSGNSVAITNNLLVNCQKVEYSGTSVYITTKGVPAYPTGPFLDGNPSQASNQNAIFKFPLAPVQNSGAPIATTAGNIGVFINGVALFDYRDGVAWSTSNNTLCGGPGNPPCSGTTYWHRDAIPAEKAGFDCSKGHPAMGNYHHHQNPSAFKLDLTVISTICNLYDADGLYKINTTQHSPLLGFAYDGFPIYGAYGYKNTNGTGGIVRIKSSYQLRNISTRTTWADGSTVPAGPAVSTTYSLGYFREDYEYIAQPSSPENLDASNGRFCVTPEYPGGTYAYFCTVDANHNSTYPYAIGPNFYGVKSASKVTSISEATTVYTTAITSLSNIDLNNFDMTVFPNPSYEFIAVQAGGLVTEDIDLKLLNLDGKQLLESKILKGTTISYLDIQKLYNGNYLLTLSLGKSQISKKVVIDRK